jgi:predicted alpha-1,6-mannanase (GH76 family)
MKEPNGDYVALAGMIFDDIWARAATHDAQGRFTGVYESISPGPAFETKAVVSNFGPAITAARLGRLTKAKAMYGWAREHLSDPSTGEVYDHLERDGSAVRWQYTYDYGVAIGAALHLYEATHDAQYRDDAYRYADYMVHHQIADWNGHPMLHDGCDQKCETQTCDCSAFKGIGYRYLAELYASRADGGDPAYTSTIDAMREVLRTSAQALWDARNARDTFPSDWGGGRRSFSSIGSEASAVMTLNIAAKDGLL